MDGIRHVPALVQKTKDALRRIVFQLAARYLRFGTLDKINTKFTFLRRELVVAPLTSRLSPPSRLAANHLDFIMQFLADTPNFFVQARQGGPGEAFSASTTKIVPFGAFAAQLVDSTSTFRCSPAPVTHERSDIAALANAPAKCYAVVRRMPVGPPRQEECARSVSQI